MNFKDLIKKYERKRIEREEMRMEMLEFPDRHGGREHAGFWDIAYQQELILIDGFLRDLKEFENDGKGMVLQLDFVETVQNFLRVMYGRKGYPGEWEMADGSSIGNFWSFVHRVEGQFTMMTGFPYQKWEAEQERLKKLDEERKLEEKEKLEAIKREERRKFIRKSGLEPEGEKFAGGFVFKKPEEYGDTDSVMVKTSSKTDSDNKGNDFKITFGHTDNFGKPKGYGWKQKYEKEAFALIKRECNGCDFNRNGQCHDGTHPFYLKSTDDTGGSCFTGKVRCVTCDNIFHIKPQIEVQECPDCKTKGFTSEVGKSELEKS